MATVAELITTLGVEITKETTKNLKSFSEGIDSAVKKLNSLALVASGLAVAGGFFIRSVMNEIGALQTLSDTSGVSAKSLQEWGYAANEVGVSAQAVQKDVGNLTEALNSPIPNTLTATYKYLGFSLRNISGELKNADEILTDLSKSLEGMSKGRADLLGKRLGLSSDTILLLRQGKDGLEALKKEANELGGIIPEEAIKRSEELRVSLTKFNFALKGITTSIAVSFMPGLKKVADFFTQWIKGNREWISLHLESFFTALSVSFDRIVAAGGRILDFFRSLINMVKSFGEGLDATEMYIHILTGALVGLGIIFAPFIAKMAAVGVILTGISLAIEDVFTYLEGGDSIIGRFIESFQTSFPGLFELIQNLAGVIKNVLVASFFVLIDAGKAVFTALESVFSVLLTVLESISVPLNDFIDTFSTRFPAIVDLVSTLAKVIGAVLGGALEAIVVALNTILHLAGKVFNFLLDKLSGALDTFDSFLSGIGFGPKKEEKSQKAKKSKEDTTEISSKYLPKSFRNNDFSLDKSSPRYALDRPDPPFTSGMSSKNPFESFNKISGPYSSSATSPENKNAHRSTDSQKDEISYSKDVFKYSPMPKQDAVQSRVTEEANSKSEPKQQRIAQENFKTITLQDNRTINQQITTSDPEQAANSVIKSLGSAPQINTAGIFTPVVR